MTLLVMVEKKRGGGRKGLEEKQQSQVLENTRDGLEIKNQAGGEATTFQNSPCVSAEDSASSLNELSGDDNIH